MNLEQENFSDHKTMIKILSYQGQQYTNQIHHSYLN